MQGLSQIKAISSVCAEHIHLCGCQLAGLTGAASYRGWPAEVRDGTSRAWLCDQGPAPALMGLCFLPLKKRTQRPHPALPYSDPLQAKHQ